MTARLVPTDAGLGLVDDEQPALSPLVLDFTASRRLSRKDPLCRALGLSRGVVTVVDATGGLGRDAIALAQAGFEVTALERSPLLQALWHDALARAGAVEHLRFVADDACAFLDRIKGTVDAPDAVFLDPMYPARQRKALQQREMRLLRAAVEGDDVEAEALLHVARSTATKRVVVKRHRDQPPLAMPSSSWEGASTSFDLYLC